MREKRLSLFTLIKYIFLGLLAVVQIVPLFYLTIFSLKDNNQIFGESSLKLPSPVRFDNYIVAFRDGGVAKYFFNSVLVSTITVFFVVLLASMVAYAVNRMEWKLSRACYVYFLMGLMIPIHSGLLPIFLILKKLSLINTYLALLLPYIGFGLSMALMIVSGFIRTIPKELEESACIDGANIYRIFFGIMFPLIMPAIATVVVVTFKNAWNELMMASVFISEATYRTLTVGLKTLTGEFFSEWGIIGAGLMIATFPVLVIYIVMSNKIQKGLIAGAMKS